MKQKIEINGLWDRGKNSEYHLFASGRACVCVCVGVSVN